jgi:hypothetical protein
LPKQWIPVNWDTSELKHFAPIKQLPQIYEVAGIGLKRYIVVQKQKISFSVYRVTNILTLDELTQLVQITEKYLP